MIHKLCILIFFVLSSCTTSSQSIHPLEPVSGHYKDLQALDSKPNPARARLDEIVFPPTNYSSGTLIYTLAAPHYLNSEQVDELKQTVTPPANSSDQTQAEIEFLLDWQKKRTKAQEDRASNVLAPIGYWPHADILKTHQRYRDNLDYLFYEGRTVLGDDCTPENYPATRKLLAGVTKDMRIMEFTVKYHLLRARPYHLSDELAPLARISSPSFASGHTLWAYIQAFTWSELVPEKRQEFLDVAYEVGESREIMGIHYPSDEEAARVLAHKMLTAMLKNPKFERELNAAKVEWQ
ncbi:MAG: phosphatase PAP2 family protein [Ekhidna sp.]